MKKFEEEFDGNINLIKTALGDVCSVTHVKAVFKDWISLEEHQAVKAENEKLLKYKQLLKNKVSSVQSMSVDRGERLNAALDEIDELKSRIEKQQPEIPEVPQFVADWLDRKPLYAINGSISIEIIEWSQKQTGYADLGRNINHLLKLKVNGYTVAKEKLFYLKNKLTGQRLIRLLEENGGGFLECVTSVDKERMQFTQQEIDSMETGSYEQSEVEE